MSVGTCYLPFEGQLFRCGLMRVCGARTNSGPCHVRQRSEVDLHGSRALVSASRMLPFDVVLLCAAVVCVQNCQPRSVSLGKLKFCRLFSFCRWAAFGDPAVHTRESQPSTLLDSACCGLSTA